MKKILWLFLFILTLPPPAYGAQPCHVVARIYDENICKSAITMAPESEKVLRERAKEAGADPDLAVREFEKSTLVAVAWEIALESKFGKDSFKPSQENIEAYLGSLEKRLQTEKKYSQKGWDLATGLLDKNEYTPENEDKLKRLAYMQGRVLDMHKIRELAKEEQKEKQADHYDEKKRRMAANLIESWKGNKLLYEAYGGDVTIQKDGPQPVGAYKAFFAEIRGQKKLAIEDPDYNDAFKSMDEYLSSGHTLIEESKRGEINKYFSQPLWFYDESLVRNQYEAFKTQALAIPALGPKKKDKEKTAQ